MCGICGILSSSGSPVNRQEVVQMTESLHHRGPDGTGIWMDERQRAGFGHRRLSIIDLSSAASQPMSTPDGSHLLVFNGEIYNYLELKKELQQTGRSFHTQSDSEVLLQAYLQWGSECLKHLDGMFAFVIYDVATGTAFAARDRFGEKPLFYTQKNGSFYFASEMKALWAIGASSHIHDDRLRMYLKERWVDDPVHPETTFYKDILQLPPAHWMKLENGKVSTGAYWRLQRNEHIMDESGAIEKFSQLLEESIRLRLRSDVPVGSSLSGGLDSSAIVAGMTRLQPLQQHTFSARFKDARLDEGAYIDLVHQRYPTLIRHDVFPDAETLEADFETLWFHQEEPFNSASIWAQYEVMRTARRQGIPVLLDGQGADELLAGYLPYYQAWLRGLAFRDRPAYYRELSQYSKLHGAQHPVATVHSLDEANFYLRRLFRNLRGKPAIIDEFDLSEIRRKALTQFGLKELLRYADRNAMAHGVEVRLPFLSHHLVEFVHNLPDTFILRQGWTKFILRESVDGALPKQIAWRADKLGYRPPQESWLQLPALANRIANARTKLNNGGIRLSDFPNVADWDVLMLEKVLRF